MKLYLAYKKQYKHRQHLGILVVTCAIILLPFAFSCAQTVSELQAQIDAHNKTIMDLESKNQEIQKQLNNLGDQEDSLSAALKQLDLSRQKIASDISITENKIEEKNLEIKELSSQIGVKQNSISQNTDAISSEIRKTNELEQGSFIESIFSDQKISDMWNDINDMATIRDQIRGQNIELTKTKTQLEDTKKATSDAKQQLVDLKSQLSDQEKIIEQNTSQKKKLLSQTKNSEALYQKTLKANLVKKKAFEAELQSYEDKLKFTLDPSKLPSQGVLSWPLTDIYVTQFFGKTEDGKRLYANGTHNGVDFRARTPLPIFAMADGVVAGTGDTDVQCPKVSFGRFVLIKYDDGLASTFGHLSLIKVSAGQRVSRGEIVGYTGSTGYATGPHLHVSVYARDAVNLQTLPSKSCPGHVLTQPISAINAYLDPMYYLPPYKK